MSDKKQNRWCTWSPNDSLAKKAKEIKGGCTRATIDSIYAYVSGNISYDYDKADRLKGGRGYVPNPEETYESGSGICFDFASLMCAMLRSVGVTCKLCVGKMDGQSHAWVLAKDGDRWLRCDPTVAANMRKRSKTSHVYDTIYEL